MLARAPLEQRGAWERTLRTRASLHGGRAGFAAARGRLDAGWPIPVSFVGMYRAAWVIIAVAAAALLVLGGNSLAGLTTPDPTQAGELPYQQVYREPSGSMEPTLGIGTKVIVSPGAPKIGEIVVFHPPEGAIVEKGCGPTPHVITPGGAACAEPVPRPSTFKTLKRIVAGPGDEIYIREGHVFRKAAGSSSFIRQQDSDTRPCGVSPECNFPTPIKISAGHWYLLGDKRGESEDSRFWGAIPTSWILGVVTACYMPPHLSRLRQERYRSLHPCKLSSKHG